MEEPLVSILIPAYKPDFFRASLESALSQNYSNLDIVIGDDCPGDDIQSIVDSLPDPRIRYIRNNPPQGPMQNYVFLFRRARGEYIKFLNDDDELAPDCISEMAPWLEDPAIALVACRRKEVDDQGRELPERLDTRPLIEENVVLNGGDLAAAMLLHKLNFVGEPTCMMFRRRDVADVRPHLMSYHGLGGERSGLGDVALALNLLERGDCAYLGAKELVRIRRFAGQWQEVSPARAWSMESWKLFRKEALRSGKIRKWNGFQVKYYAGPEFGRLTFIHASFLRRRIMVWLEGLRA